MNPHSQPIDPVVGLAEVWKDADYPAPADVTTALAQGVLRLAQRSGPEEPPQDWKDIFHEYRRHGRTDAWLYMEIQAHAIIALKNAAPQCPAPEPTKVHSQTKDGEPARASSEAGKERERWIKRLHDHARHVGGDYSYDRLFGSEACALADFLQHQCATDEGSR